MDEKRIYLLAYKAGSYEDINIHVYDDPEAAKAKLESLPPNIGGLIVGEVLDLRIPGPSQVALFNALHQQFGGDPKIKVVTKFSTKDDGATRIWDRLVWEARSMPVLKKSLVNEQNALDTPADPLYEHVTASEEAPTEQESDMAAKTAKKTKAAKAPKAAKEKTARKSAPLFGDLPQNLKPAADMTCGCFIRSLLMKGKGTERILELVHSHFPDSSAKASDVSWNKAKLVAAGEKVPTAE